MSARADALAFLREHEGEAFVSGEDESSGASRWGVPLRCLRSLEGDLGDIDGDGDVDDDDVRALTWDDACVRVWIPMWERNGYGSLQAGVARKVFDLTANAGPKQSHTILQRACRACGMDDLTEDGILGLETRRATNCCNPDSLVIGLRSEAAGFYRLLVAKRETRRKWIVGWLRRAYA